MRFQGFLTAMLAAVVLGTLPRALAQGLPDLGDVSGATLPPQIERRIGEQIMREIRRDPSYLDDPELNDYLNVLGGKLAAAVPGSRHDFEFFGLRDPTINAFALPGGFVGVHSGLLTASESESEVASVLAHEIAHVTQRHIARLLGAQQQMQLPAMVAIAAALLLGRSRPDLAGAAITAAQGAAAAGQLSYSRDFEREADRVGFQTLSSAGFDVRAMAVFFEKMQRFSRIYDDGSLPSYLRSHPVTTERIADAQNRAAGEPYRQHASSLEFQLVRARLRAEAGEPREAVAHFSGVLRDGRHASEAAARYGLAGAQLRAKAPAEAQAEVARLRALRVESPMIDTLDARVRMALGDGPGALAVLKASYARHPHRRPVLYAYAAALLELGRSEEALALLAEPLRLYPRDARMHQLRARAYAAQGKRLLQHQALAEAYVLQGSLPAAIDQLQLAQAAGDGDFYQLSVVDARLKELRAEHARDLQDAKNRR
jgi:predicted Zn-dependent protease